MGGRGWVGVLAGLLLISITLGGRDAPANGRVRVLLAEKDGEVPKSGKDVPSSPVQGGVASQSSVPKSVPTPSNTTNSPPASTPPPNPPASQRAPSFTAMSAHSSGSKPASGSPSVQTLGDPSHPPPKADEKLNSSSSVSGRPKKPPSPAVPSRRPPAIGEGSNPLPPPGKYPSPVESKRPEPAQTEQKEGTSPNGKDEKDKDKKKQTTLDGSPGEGQEYDKCDASMPIICRVDYLVACLQRPKNASEKWYLLMQNEGNNYLNVKIVVPSSLGIVKTVPLQQHKTWKTGFHVDTVEGLKIVLNAGNGNCNLQMAPPYSAANIFQQLPGYANRVTPIYGVYLASLTVIFIGVTWACCKLRKRRRIDGGVAYQQLEMSTQQASGAGGDGNVTSGWDEGWDDEWDEEEALPRPAKERGNASENGVTHKSSDKNEWEDWDD